jgi:hypothetical protein
MSLAPKQSKNEVKKTEKLIEGRDFYFEGNLMVLTEIYHLNRGYCCGNGCRHCPYQSKNVSSSSE